MKLERQLRLVIKSAEPNETQLYVGVAASEDVDRLMERVNLKGLRNLTEYLENPILLYNHNPNEPIGRIESVEITDDKIVVAFRFASTPKAQEIKTLVDEGILRALSIGFVSYKQRLEDGVLVHDDWAWVETSIVSLPANPKALIMKELETKAAKSGTTPFADWDLDMEREWDADESEIRWRKHLGIESSDDLEDPEVRRKYMKRFFWWDGDGTKFSSYKLPFVDVVNGEPKAIWRGVVAAMAALLGARGGVDIPESDRKEVYEHIVKYYKKADKEPPEYHKALELIEAIKAFVSKVTGKDD